MPDTAHEVRAILSRTLRELDEAIENPSVSSILSGLGSLLGVDDGDSTVAPSARASRTTGSAPRAAASPCLRLPAAVQPQAARAYPRQRRRRRRAGAAVQRLAVRSLARRRRAHMALARAAGETISSRSSASRRASRLPKAATRFWLKDSTGLYRVARRLQEEGLVLRRRGAELRAVLAPPRAGLRAQSRKLPQINHCDSPAALATVPVLTAVVLGLCCAVITGRGCTSVNTRPSWTLVSSLGSQVRQSRRRRRTNHATSYGSRSTTR